MEMLSFCPASLNSSGMSKNYWMVKQEPEAYSWNTFVKDGGTTWTGVRNFQARNNLRAMKKGDQPVQGRTDRVSAAPRGRCTAHRWIVGRSAETGEGQ